MEQTEILKLTIDASESEEALSSLMKHNEAVKKSVDDLTKSNKKYNNSIDDTTDSIEDSEKAVKDLSKTTTKASKTSKKSFSQMSKSAGSVGKSLWNLTKIPILALLSAVTAAVGALGAAAGRTEEEQNRLAKATGAIGVVFDNIADKASSMADLIIQAFTDPDEAIRTFNKWVTDSSKIFDKTIGDFNGGIIDFMGAKFSVITAKMGVSWAKFVNIFTDNTDGMIEAQKGLVDALEEQYNATVRINSGIEETNNLVEEQTQKISDQIAINNQIEDSITRLNKLRRAYNEANATDEARISELRAQVADKERYDAETRMQFLQEAQDLANKIADRNVEIAREELKNIQLKNALSKSSQEDLERESEAKVKLALIEKQRNDQLASFEGERQSAINENLALLQKELDLNIQIAKAELDNWTLLNKTKLDLTKDFNAEQIRLEQERLEEQERLQLEQLERERLNAVNKANITAQEIALINQNYANQEIAIKQATEESKKAIDDEVKALEAENMLIQRESVLAQRQLELEEIDLQQKQINEILKKNLNDGLITTEEYENKKANVEDNARNLKLQADLNAAMAGADIAGQALEAISGLVDENSKAYKHIQAANTTIDGIKGAISAYSSLASIPIVGPALGVAAAAGVAATTAKAVKDIYKTDPKKQTQSSTSISTSTLASSTSAVSSVPATTTPAISNVNAEIGQGIVARENQVSQTQTTNTVLVVDDVTAKQAESNKIKTSSNL